MTPPRSTIRPWARAAAALALAAAIAPATLRRVVDILGSASLCGLGLGFAPSVESLARVYADELDPDGQAVVARGLPTNAIAGLEHHRPHFRSATTASESSGHRSSASGFHSMKWRSVRATSPVSIAGSTHIIVPDPP